MKETFTRVSATELFATEIGVSGAPLPTNGPGRKYPLVKYLILGGLILGVIALAHHLSKNQSVTIKSRKNE